MNTNSNYPEHTQETAEYQGGYPAQPYPPQYPAPYPQQQMQPYPQSQPLQPGYPQQPMMPMPGYPPMQQGYPPQQIQMPYPYPQQQMMMPQPINVIVNNANNNVNANVGRGGYVRVRKRGTPILLSIVYFCCIGLPLGFYWIVIALVLTALGKEAGQRMMKQLPMVFFLRQQ